jgi:hypothetical protein
VVHGAGNPTNCRRIAGAKELAKNIGSTYLHLGRLGAAGTLSRAAET